MTIQDVNTVDPSFTTPDGKPLNVGARNPHLQSDVIHGGEGGGNSAESTIVLELVDYVAEHTVGGSTQRVLQTSDMTDTLLSGTSPLWRHDGYQHPPDNQFASLDASTSWKWVGQLQTEVGKHYTVLSSVNWHQSTIKFLFGSEQRPLTSVYETMDFVGDGSLVEVGYLFEANTRNGSVNDFYVETQVGSTIVPSTCTSFVRKIVDGIVSDFESDGVTPYIVSGTILAHCPDASGCDCSSELTDVKQELVDIKALVQQLLNGQTPPPTQTQVDIGRNSTNYFMKAQTLSSAADTLQSLVGYKGGAEVAATTTPAVVTTGKTYRINHIAVTYVTVSKVGSVIVSLRANKGGLVSITSPVVNSWQVGGSASSVGTTQTIVIPFPDGLEFEAGTGIGLSVQGFASAGAEAAVGYVKASINGFEY